MKIFNQWKQKLNELKRKKNKPNSDSYQSNSDSKANDKKNPEIHLSPEQKRLSRTINLYALIIITLIILLGLLTINFKSQQNRLFNAVQNQKPQITSIEKTIENTSTRFQKFVSRQNKMNQLMQKRDHKIKKKIKTIIKKRQAFIKKNENLLKKLAQNQKKLNKTLSSKKSEFSKTIEAIKNDQKKLNKIAKQFNSLFQKAPTQKLKPAKKYRIYTITPYGVILQDANGNYIIAQINKQLPIGKIKSISKNKVVAGDKVITYKKDFNIKPADQ